MSVSTTGSFPIPVGGQQVRVDDGAQSPPAGMQLVNRGDNGGTVWISAGPAGAAAAVPLGPGATLRWTDTGAYPYAYLSAAATAPETLVVSGQADGYSNPSTVAASLIAQGIPSTMLDTAYGDWLLNAGQSTGTIGTTQTGGTDVSRSSTLIVSVQWPQAPAGANVLRLAFDDPSRPSLPPMFFYLTNNNAVEQAENTWQVPVVAPRLVMTNLQPPDNNNGQADVTVVGNNRPPAGGFRMLTGGIGTKTLFATVAAAVGLSPVAQPTAGDATQGSTVQGTLLSTGPMTRFTGPVTVSCTVGNITGGGIVQPYWVDETGRINSPRLFFVTTATTGPNMGLNDFTFQWMHPPVPVWWRYDASGANSGNYIRLTVNGAV